MYTPTGLSVNKNIETNAISLSGNGTSLVGKQIELKGSADQSVILSGLVDCIVDFSKLTLSPNTVVLVDQSCRNVNVKNASVLFTDMQTDKPAITLYGTGCIISYSVVTGAPIGYLLIGEDSTVSQSTAINCMDDYRIMPTAHGATLGYCTGVGGRSFGNRHPDHVQIVGTVSDPIRDVLILGCKFSNTMRSPEYKQGIILSDGSASNLQVVDTTVATSHDIGLFVNHVTGLHVSYCDFGDSKIRVGSTKPDVAGMVSTGLDIVHTKSG